MNSELKSKREKRHMAMKNRYNKAGMATIFVIGAVYCGKRIEALKLYDIETNSACLQSVGTIIKRLEAGEKILGLHYRYYFKPDCRIKKELVFENGAYNCKHVDIVNGKGEVIESKNETIIGLIEEPDKDYCIVMNGDCQISKISYDEAIDKELNGLVKTRSGLICYASCRILDPNMLITVQNC